MFQCHTWWAAQITHAASALIYVVQAQAAQTFALEVFASGCLYPRNRSHRGSGTGNAVYYCGEELCLGRGEADGFWGVLWLQVVVSYPTAQLNWGGRSGSLLLQVLFLSLDSLECVCGQFPHLPCCNIAAQALVALLVLTFQKALLVHTAGVHNFCCALCRYLSFSSRYVA